MAIGCPLLHLGNKLCQFFGIAGDLPVRRTQVIQPLVVNTIKTY